MAVHDWRWSNYRQCYVRLCGQCGEEYTRETERLHSSNACTPKPSRSHREEVVPGPAADALVEKLRRAQVVRQQPSVFCSRCGGDGGATGNCPRCGGNGLEPAA